MVVTVNHAVSHGLRLSLFILPFAIMVVLDTLSCPGGPPASSSSLCSPSAHCGQAGCGCPATRVAAEALGRIKRRCTVARCPSVLGAGGGVLTETADLGCVAIEVASTERRNYGLVFSLRSSSILLMIRPSGYSYIVLNLLNLSI